MSGNWGIVGYAGDPIPDDPGVVAAQVAHIRAVAADIAAQVAALPTDGTIDAIEWDSEAAAGFKRVVKKLPKDLKLLEVRYSKVGAAMETFQSVLANSKGQAADNLIKAQTAYNEMTAAQAGVHNMQDFAQQAQQAASRQNASAPPGTRPVTPQPWTGPNYPAQLAAAQQAFNAAKAAIVQAVRAFHNASQQAAHAVAAASNDGLKNDTSFWGSIGNFLGSVAHWIAGHVPLQAISGILGKIAAVAAILSFVPFLGQLADVVAVAAASGALLCDLITAADHLYTGDAGWGDVLSIGLDVVAVAVGGRALTNDFAVAGQTATVAKTTEAARAADATAAAATSTREAAQAAYEAKAAALATLRSSGILTRVWSRVTLQTRALVLTTRAAGGSLESAASAEQAALEAAKAAHAELSAATKSLDLLKGTGQGLRVKGLVTAGATQTNAMAQEHALSTNVPNSVVRSTTLEFRHLVALNDDPASDSARSAGARVPAQPIPVGAGTRP